MHVLQQKGKRNWGDGMESKHHLFWGPLMKPHPLFIWSVWLNPVEENKRLCYVLDLAADPFRQRVPLLLSPVYLWACQLRVCLCGVYVFCVCVFKLFGEKLVNDLSRRPVSLHHNGNSPPLYLLLRFASISSSSSFSSYFLLLLPLPWCHLVISLLPYVNLNYCHRELSHIAPPYGYIFTGTWQAKLSVCARVCVSTWVWDLPPDLSVSFPSLPLSFSLPSSFSLSTGSQNGWAKVSPPSPPQSESQILTSPRSPDWVMHPWWPRP